MIKGILSVTKSLLRSAQYSYLITFKDARLSLRCRWAFYTSEDLNP